MKLGLLGPAAYGRRLAIGPGWPVPPEACDPETAATSYRDQLDQFQLADEFGFDWISVSEHHFAPRLLTPNPFILAAAASQRTKNVRIALLGPLLPLANPVRVAEEVAMLDSISGGRVVVLPLRGTPNEHLTYSTDGKASPWTREITQEGTRLMVKAWQEPQPFSWRGRHFNFEHIAVWPRVLQQPHPPVFFSGNSTESIEFAAANRLSIAIGFAPAAQVAKHVALYKQCAEAAGWTPTHDNVLYRAIALVTPDDEMAQQAVNRARSASAQRRPRPEAASYGPSATAEAPQVTPGEGGGAPFAAGFQFYGTPRTIVEQMRTYCDAGVGILDIALPGQGMGGTPKAMEAIAEVIPAIHDL